MPVGRFRPRGDRPALPEHRGKVPLVRAARWRRIGVDEIHAVAGQDSASGKDNRVGDPGATPPEAIFLASRRLERPKSGVVDLPGRVYEHRSSGCRETRRNGVARAGRLTAQKWYV